MALIYAQIDIKLSHFTMSKLHVNSLLFDIFQKCKKQFLKNASAAMQQRQHTEQRVHQTFAPKNTEKWSYPEVLTTRFVSEIADIE